MSTPGVLFFLSNLGLGGSESKFVRLAGSLASRGTRVGLAYMQVSEHEQLLAQIDRRVSVVALQRRAKFSPTVLARLIATIRSHEARAVVAVNLYTTLYVALARWWLGRGSFRFLASINTTGFVNAKHERQMWLYRRVLRQADVLIFGAHNQRRLWCEQYGLDGGDAATTVLYNGVDTERFAPRAVQSDRAGATLATRYVIGTVGGLRSEKAQVDLVRATARLRSRGLDVGALIVGDGPERIRIEAEIERCALQKHAVLIGATSDVRPFLALMDVFVVSSISETFSNAALEAMSSGIPVVASAVGGMTELLGGGGGLIYPPRDVAQLSDLLAELLPDTARLRQMGAAGRRAAVERFGYDRMIENFISLLPQPMGEPVESRRHRGEPITAPLLQAGSQRDESGDSAHRQ